jgi:hypothetical protein
MKINKKCTKCKRLQPIKNFCKDKNRKDKLYCYCKNCVNQYHKKYYQKNKVQIKKYHKEYQFNHKIERNKRRKINRTMNIQYKLVENLRNRIWYSLKRNCKSTTTIKLLGCSLNFLKKYLEKQFKRGMNWNNYGYYGWHVDHKIPCAKFNLSKKSEQYKCFNYTNLQPLWAKENMKKGRNG